MTRPIHLEGMGLIGAITAWRLHQLGLEFTWHDTEQPHCAWPASTGCIYPSNTPFDLENYRRWAAWSRTPPWPKDWNVVETAAYWYSSKGPPHGIAATPLRDLGPLRLHPQPSYHLNVQELVLRTRQAFGARRLDVGRTPHPSQCDYLVTHGFSERLDHYLWGWSAAVHLTLDPRLQWASQRPCLYLRRLRYVFGYLYPRPNTDTWYAGSSLIVQRNGKDRELDVQGKLDAWAALVAEHTEGLVQIVSIESTAQGWRPAPSTVGDVTAPLVELRNGKHCVRPLWHSGVRWSPLATDALIEQIRPGLVSSPALAVAPRQVKPQADTTGVRLAQAEDHDWIQAIWKPEQRILGAFGVAWHRFWFNTPGDAERWVVVPGKGFAHYRQKRDGTVSLYEIAVAADARRQGVGRMLLAYLSEQGSRTVQLKTDADHPDSNAFYRALGFTFAGSRSSKNGKKQLNEYIR